MKFERYRLGVYGEVAQKDGNAGDGHAASPIDRGSEFQAVEGGTETMNGSLLMVEAYAFLWLVLFGFIWYSWRTQRRIDGRVAELERSLAAVSGASRGGVK